MNPSADGPYLGGCFAELYHIAIDCQKESPLLTESEREVCTTIGRALLPQPVGPAHAVHTRDPEVVALAKAERDFLQADPPCPPPDFPTAAFWSDRRSLWMRCELRPPECPCPPPRRPCGMRAAGAGAGADATAGRGNGFAMGPRTSCAPAPPRPRALVPRARPTGTAQMLERPRQTLRCRGPARGGARGRGRVAGRRFGVSCSCARILAAPTEPRAAPLRFPQPGARSVGWTLAQPV